MDARRVGDRIKADMNIEEGKRLVKEYNELQPAHQKTLSAKNTETFKPKYPTLKNFIKFVESCVI